MLRRVARAAVSILVGLLQFAGCAGLPHYDVVIHGGTVYDGRGGPPRVADVAIDGDRIAAIGDLGSATAGRTPARPATSSRA
jgi:hypothetical protein